eukprot:482208-Rhodomonas_salina.1
MSLDLVKGKDVDSCKNRVRGKDRVTHNASRHKEDLVTSTQQVERKKNRRKDLELADVGDLLVTWGEGADPLPDHRHPPALRRTKKTPVTLPQQSFDLL